MQAKEPVTYRSARESFHEAISLLEETHSGSDVHKLVRDLVEAVWLSHLRRRRLTVFIGAGVANAIEVGAPLSSFRWSKNWNELIDDLAETLDRRRKPGGKQKTIAKLLAKRLIKGPKADTVEKFSELFMYADRLHLAWLITAAYAEVVDQLDGFPGENPYSRARRLRDVDLSGKLPRVGMGLQMGRVPLLDSIWGLPVCDILTTNYDHCLEIYERDRNIQGASDYVSTEDDLYRHIDHRWDRRRVIYLHGRALESGQEQSEKVRPLVLDRDDYARLMTGEDGFLDLALEIMRKSSTFYVGYSMEDPTLDWLVQRLWAKQGARPDRFPSYVFLTRSLEPERAYWRERGIRAVVLKEHGDLERLLACIGSVARFASAASPRELPPLVATGGDINEANNMARKAAICIGFRNPRRALSFGRAALGVGLFNTTNQQASLDRVVEAEARLQLARAHYALCRAEDSDGDGRLLEENLAALREALTPVVEGGAERDDSNLRALVILASAKLAEGRQLVMRGVYRGAAQVFADAVSCSAQVLQHFGLQQWVDCLEGAGNCDCSVELGFEVQLDSNTVLILRAFSAGAKARLELCRMLARMTRYLPRAERSDGLARRAAQAKAIYVLIDAVKSELAKAVPERRLASLDEALDQELAGYLGLLQVLGEEYRHLLDQARSFVWRVSTVSGPLAFTHYGAEELPRARAAFEALPEEAFQQMVLEIGVDSRGQLELRTPAARRAAIRYYAERWSVELCASSGDGAGLAGSDSFDRFTAAQAYILAALRITKWELVDHFRHPDKLAAQAFACLDAARINIVHIVGMVLFAKRCGSKAGPSEITVAAFLHYVHAAFCVASGEGLAEGSKAVHLYVNQLLLHLTLLPRNVCQAALRAFSEWGLLKLATDDLDAFRSKVYVEFEQLLASVCADERPRWESAEGLVGNATLHADVAEVFNAIQPRVMLEELDLLEKALTGTK